MLVLFETPAGFALFKVLDEGKLSKVEDLWKEFSTADTARKVLLLLLSCFPTRLVNFQ
nr:probable nucleolar protein 5-2 [Ipomoea batatas]